MSHTRSQKVARAAFTAVERRSGAGADKYLAFARQFPTLVHTCGLAQATAFAMAKGGEKLDLLTDLAAVLREAREYTATDGPGLHQMAVSEPVWGYLRITRDALLAASWLKRYAEALLVPAGEGDS